MGGFCWGCGGGFVSTWMFKLVWTCLIYLSTDFLISDARICRSRATQAVWTKCTLDKAISTSWKKVSGSTPMFLILFKRYRQVVWLNDLNVYRKLLRDSNLASVLIFWVFLYSFNRGVWNDVVKTLLSIYQGKPHFYHDTLHTNNWKNCKFLYFTKWFLYVSSILL